MSFRNGAKDGVDPAVCDSCKGRGIIEKVVQIAPGMFAPTRAECEDCHGHGNHLDEESKCAACKGEKVVKEENEFDIKLDCGAPENHLYAFPGEGHEIVSYLY